MNLDGFESFQITIGDKILNPLVYAIVKKNMRALRFLVEDYKLNMAQFIGIQQQIVNEEPFDHVEQSNVPEQIIISLDPYFTLKVALDTFDPFVFQYVLDMGLAHYDTKNGKLEELFTYMQTLKFPKTGKSEQVTRSAYMEMVINSQLFRKWLTENTSNLHNKIII